jgi:Spy/CpxP family protein refolding chaperone
MENKAPRSTALALVVVLFILGIAIGAVGTYVLVPRLHVAGPGHHATNEMVKKLTHELGLTAEQQTQLGVIIDDTKSKYHALDEQIGPQKEKIHQQARERIRALLTPEQEPKFEEFLRRIDEEHKKAGG